MRTLIRALLGSQDASRSRRSAPRPARAAIGGGLDLPWDASFVRKSRFDESESYPRLDELSRTLGQLAPLLQTRLAVLGAAELAAAAPRRFPIADTSVRGMIAFLAYHEAYHVGQVGYLVKWLGYPGIVDG